MENFTLSMSIQNLPQVTLKLTTKVPEKLDAFLFWGFFWDGICQIRTIPWMATVLRSSLTVTSQKGLMPISDWPPKLSDGPLKSSKRSVTYVALSLGESHQYGEIFGNHGDPWDVVVERVDPVSCFFFGVIVGFCWKWRSPSRLKIWETGDFHLTSLSSILIGRALEIIRMSVFQWAFLFFLLGLFGVLERICIIHLVVCEVRNYPFTSYLKSIESIS